ncbi:flp pilus assembly protein tadB [Vibrio ishigakensis]|uniref:Flp pilus assembly protein tadB n=1 Tax=Vibrio ishigakensis TaxID=1481914 RepID=A0A0B8P5I1_9VIBR|nr:flp pilus assembly protein tadB [Vibrio ishigakensis]
MALWLLVAIGVAVLGFLIAKRKPDPRFVFLEQESKGIATQEITAVNMKGLTQNNFLQELSNLINIIKASLGRLSELKILLFVLTINCFAYGINERWLNVSILYFNIGITLVSSFFAVRFIIEKRRKAFDNDFPDALNILMSAVTAGESINSAFAYVGRVADNDVGREFKDISDRMKLGESIETIFERSCKRFPYPPFLFFVITIRANMERGGQLKNVLGKLIRVLVEARNLEKKKMAMTSEARISAKIVGAIPFAFMLLLNWINPQDLNFVLFHPDGRWILYYLLFSEGTGMFIVWWLVKSIR